MKLNLLFRLFNLTFSSWNPYVGNLRSKKYLNVWNLRSTGVIFPLSFSLEWRRRNQAAFEIMTSNIFPKTTFTEYSRFWILVHLSLQSTHTYKYMSSSNRAKISSRYLQSTPRPSWRFQLTSNWKSTPEPNADCYTAQSRMWL